jgi:hypothetical protein
MAHAPTVTDVGVVIRMHEADTDLSNALTTCTANKLKCIYILDNINTAKSYRDIKRIAALRATGYVIRIFDNKKTMLNAMTQHYYKLEISPHAKISIKSMDRILEPARKNWETKKRYAMQPVVKMANTPGNILVLALHVLFTIISAFTFFRQHRRDHARVTVLRREVTNVITPEHVWRHSNQDTVKEGGILEPELSGFSYFIYVLSREFITWRVFIGMTLWTLALIYYAIAATKSVNSLSWAVALFLISIIVSVISSGKAYAKTPGSILLSIFAPFVFPFVTILIILRPILFRSYFHVDVAEDDALEDTN